MATVDAVQKNEDLRAKLQIYEEQQKSIMESMGSQVQNEVKTVTANLDMLDRETQQALNVLGERVKKLETGGGEAKKVSLVHAQSFVPEALSKDEDWRKWKSDVEDYCEELVGGMKGTLAKARKTEDAMNADWFDLNIPGDEDLWGRGNELWTFLKRYTAGEARQVVTSVAEDNGWEARRKLISQYEPGIMARVAHALPKFTSMTIKRAKTPKETRSLMTELKARAKRVFEVTRIQIDPSHEMSVITGIVDLETLKHTAQWQKPGGDVKELKRKVIEFANLDDRRTRRK
jgi:hypothetical protein